MILYNILKVLIGLGIKLYYREIRVQNKENLYSKGPLIIVANHPNTLMDAWIIGFIYRRPIYYMAKGTYFNTPLKRWFLKSIGLIPINRAIDGNTTGVNNKDSFELCYKILEEGKILVIFPEGNSVQERSLRQLKSGAARIALETEKRNNGKLGLKILPIGLVYMRGHKFRSSVFLKIGKIIDPLLYLEEFKTDSLKAARKLTDEFKVRLERCLVKSESNEQDLMADEIVEILSTKFSKKGKKGVEEDVELIKKIYEQLNIIWISQPWKILEIEQLIYQIKWQMEKLDIKSDLLDNRQHIGGFFNLMFQSVLFLIIGLPLFLYGALHSVFPFKTTAFLMPKLIKNIEYYAPVAVLLGLVLYPLTYFSFLTLVNYYIELSWYEQLIYLFSMPITGMYSYYFVQYIGQVAFKWNFLFIMMTKMDTIHALQADRDRLHKLVFD